VFSWDVQDEEETWVCFSSVYKYITSIGKTTIFSAFFAIFPWIQPGFTPSLDKIRLIGY
jgi:hypothetical protein